MYKTNRPPILTINLIPGEHSKPFETVRNSTQSCYPFTTRAQGSSKQQLFQTYTNLAHHPLSTERARNLKSKKLKNSASQNVLLKTSYKINPIQEQANSKRKKPKQKAADFEFQSEKKKLSIDAPYSSAYHFLTSQTSSLQDPKPQITKLSSEAHLNTESTYYATSSNLSNLKHASNYPTSGPNLKRKSRNPEKQDSFPYSNRKEAPFKSKSSINNNYMNYLLCTSSSQKQIARTHSHIDREREFDHSLPQFQVNLITNNDNIHELYNHQNQQNQQNQHSQVQVKELLQQTPPNKFSNQSNAYNPNYLQPSNLLFGGSGNLGSSKKLSVQLTPANLKNYHERKSKDKSDFFFNKNYPEVYKQPYFSILNTFKNVELLRSRVIALLKNSEIPLQIKKNEIIALWEELIEECTHFDCFEIEFSAQKILGDIYLQFRDFPHAILSYKYAKSFAQSKMKFGAKLLIYGQLGYIYRLLNKHEIAIAVLKKQLQLAWDTNNRKRELEAYDNLGLEYFYLGDSARAIYYHDRTMKGQFEDHDSPLKDLSTISMARQKQIYISKFHDNNSTIDQYGSELIDFEKEWQNDEIAKSIKKMEFQKKYPEEALRKFNSSHATKDEKIYTLDELPSPKSIYQREDFFSIKNKQKNTIQKEKKLQSKKKESKEKQEDNTMQFTLPELQYLNKKPKLRYLKTELDKSRFNEIHSYTMSLKHINSFREKIAKRIAQGAVINKRRIPAEEKIKEIKQEFSPSGDNYIISSEKKRKHLNSNQEQLVPFSKFGHLSRSPLNFANKRLTNEKVFNIVDQFKALLLKEILKTSKKNDFNTKLLQKMLKSVKITS